MYTLEEIFSAASDQARLVTTLIATLSALAIVYLTHYFTNRRSKTELRLNKLEETYRASIRYRKKAHDLLMIPSVMANRPITGNDELLEKWGLYAEAKEELEILVVLYAPFLNEMLLSMDAIIRRATVKDKTGAAPEGIADNYRGYNQYYQDKLSNFDKVLLSEIKNLHSSRSISGSKRRRDFCCAAVMPLLPDGFARRHIFKPDYSGAEKMNHKERP